MSAAITSYTDPEVLTSSVEDGERYHIFILDVEMPGMDGLETARRLRRQQPNAPLLFLGSYPQFASEGYKVEALRYVSKLDLEKSLPEALEKALNTIETKDSHSILVQRYQNFTRILYRDILYVRKVGRNVEIFTAKQGSISTSRGIRRFSARSMIPGLSWRIEDTLSIQIIPKSWGPWMVMTNGDRISVSRSMMPSVKKAIITLWGKGD